MRAAVHSSIDREVQELAGSSSKKATAEVLGNVLVSIYRAARGSEIERFGQRNEAHVERSRS